MHASRPGIYSVRSVLIVLAILSGESRAPAADAPSVEKKASSDTLLFVRTTPNGAEVRLNGKPLGKSDDLFPVEPGTYKVVIDLEGYQPHEQQITVRDGKITRIELRLEKQPARAAVSEKEAIAEVGKLGGRVAADRYAPGRPVVAVDLSATKVADAQLAFLKAMPRLKSLNLIKTTIGDAGLLHVKGLADLESLSLNETEITDAGLESVKGLTRLQTLNLNETNATDAGLAYLAGLINLQHLYLRAPKVTGTGLEHLKGLHQLRDLNMDGTKVTDAALVHLKDMPQLSYLGLGQTLVTDVGLEHVGALTQLERLNLKDTGITDAGLKHLERLNQLRDLNLWGTKVSGEGVKKLQKALPYCTIRSDWNPAVPLAIPGARGN